MTRTRFPLPGLILAAALAGAPAAAQDTTGAATMTVRMQTSHGTITLELDAEKAPETVANFEEYARAGFGTAMPTWK